MTFTILPASIKDIENVYNVYFDAFRGELINEVFFPQGTDDKTFREHHAAAVLDWWHKSEYDYTFKCIDTRSGKIVGMAIWNVYWRRRSAEERPKPEIGWLQGKERERAEAFAMPFWEMKEKLFDDHPYIYCHVMAVHPDYQRRGIGQMLTQWGIAQAEQMSLPIYLESTMSAVRLYEKVGFQRLAHGVHLGHDVTGEDGDLEAPIFVKLPSKPTKPTSHRLEHTEWIKSIAGESTEYLREQLRV